MEVRLLGTGAADGIPGFFSDNRVSRYAREHGGKDVRTRSGALIDGHIKIDLPPDTFAQVVRDRLSPEDWSALIFTHSHDDHFALEEIQYGMFPFVDREYLPYPIFGNETVIYRLQDRYPGWPIEFHKTKSFCPFEHLGYRITPIHAHHLLEEDAQNLIFEKDKTFLYATDTGIWGEESWQFLKSYRLDGMVIECAEGFASTAYYGHLDVDECIEVVERLRESGVLKPGAKVVTTHHSHSGDGTHAELEAALSPHGIEVGYDGMVFHV